ncbi:MAG: hypothetical protein FWG89_06125 [Treponema sp.]|nr:hypothetical protein [Treponema sp.]
MSTRLMRGPSAGQTHRLRGTFTTDTRLNQVRTYIAALFNGISMGGAL